MDAMWPHEHPSAKAPDLLPRIVKKVDGICFCTEAARNCPGRASVRRPHGLAIPVDGHSVRTTPWSSLRTQTRPIPDDAIGVGAGVHRVHLVRLNGSASLLPLKDASLHYGQNDNQRR